MERQEAIKNFLEGATFIQDSLSQQLALFPGIHQNLQDIRNSIEKLKAEREAAENAKKEKITPHEEPKEVKEEEKKDDLDTILEEARKGMVDPVISSFSYEDHREQSVREFGWHIFDAAWWYFAEQHPGEPEAENTYYPPYFFHPRSYGIQIWNGLYNLFVVAIAFIIPYDLGASVPIHCLWFASLLATVATAVDIYVRSRTALDTWDGLVTDPSRVVRFQFSNGKMLADFFTGFPWIIIGQFDFHIIMLFHLICVRRLWDSRDIVVFFSPSKVATRYGMSNVSVKLLQIYGCQVIYWHWASCANIKFGLKSKEIFPFDIYTDHFERISSRQYDYFNLNTPQKYMNVLFICFGCAFDVVFLTVLESYLTHMNGASQKFQERVDELHHYADYKGFGITFRTKLVQHYEHKYPDAQYFDEKHVTSQLNESIQRYISVRGCQTLLTKVPFFRDLDQTLITQILMILELEYYTTDDFIIEESTQGDKMYFIVHGKVEVVVNGASKARMLPGQFFGEIALLLGTTKRTASIRAISNCILYSLSRKNFDVILDENPGLTRKLKQVAEDRLNSDKQKQMAQQAISSIPMTPLAATPGTRRSSLARTPDTSARRDSVALSLSELIPRASLNRRTSLAKSIGELSFMSSKSASSNPRRPSGMDSSTRDSDAVSMISVKALDHMGRQQSYLNFLEEEDTPSEHDVDLIEQKDLENIVKASEHDLLRSRHRISIVTSPPSPVIAKELEEKEIYGMAKTPAITLDLPIDDSGGPRTSITISVKRQGKKSNLLQFSDPSETLSIMTKKMKKDEFGREHSIIEYDGQPAAVPSPATPLERSFVKYDIEDIEPMKSTGLVILAPEDEPVMKSSSRSMNKPHWRKNMLKELSEALGSDLSLHPSGSIVFVEDKTAPKPVKETQKIPVKPNQPGSHAKPPAKSPSPKSPLSSFQGNRPSSLRQSVTSPRENKSAFAMPITREDSDTDKRSVASDL